MNFYKRMIENDKYELVLENDNGQSMKMHYGGADFYWTMTESGISIPIVHDKYSYCHGRSTMSHHNDHSLVMFNSGNELDKLLLDILGEYYKNIITINGKYGDFVLDDFYYTYQAMLLSYDMACSADKDLSRVKYSPVTKVLYKYKGEM